MTQLQTKFNLILKDQWANAARQVALRLIPEQTDEQRAEAVALVTAQGAITDRLTPALEAVEAEQAVTTDNGGEGAERRALIERADWGNYLGASLHGRALDGPESELNAATGAVAGNGGVPVPWEVLAGCRPPVEKRADATTALPADGNHDGRARVCRAALYGRIVRVSHGAYRHASPLAAFPIPVIERRADSGVFRGQRGCGRGRGNGVTFKTADPTRLQAAVVLRASLTFSGSPGLIAAIQSRLGAWRRPTRWTRKSLTNCSPT